MKTIFKKEWRENFKIAAIGFAIYTFLLVQGYRACSNFFTSLALADTSWEPRSAQPLLSGEVLSNSAMFCGLFGAILGWVQIFNERHRDLWAFLVHRPISRTEIFFGKVTAGLCLYVLGAGLPLVGFIVMATIPGHFPVPFQGKMVLPLTASFLSGFVCYFGGLLTGARQARWYASRGLGFGAGIIVSLIITRVSEFWRVWVFLIPALLILVPGAWGSFVNNGYYEGQPKAGRRALVAALMLGCFVVVNFVMMTLMSLRSEIYYGQSAGYQMTRDGTLYKVTQTPGKLASITDLKGTTLMDPKTGRPMLQKDFDQLLAHTESISLYFKTNPSDLYNEQSFGDSANYFFLWRQTMDTLWYWCPNGRLWGYDLQSRRFIGSLGPNGFATGISIGSDRFSRLEGPHYGSGYYDENYPSKTLMTDAALYELDYDNRTSRPFFTTTNNERIGAATDVSFGYGNWDYTLVGTKDFVRVLTPDGKCVSQISLEPFYPSYSSVSVCFLQTNEFAFWLYPTRATNQLMGWKLPQHIFWVAADQKVFKTLDLPSERPRDWKMPFIEWLPCLVVAPASYVISPFSFRGDILFGFERLKYQWEGILMSVIGAIVYAGIGWELGRRYCFSLQDQVKWAVWHLFFSLPGLLAFICVQEWPARETCPNCKKLRLVNREKCEYCDAEFAPPAKNGTEVFEVAAPLAHEQP
jgi:ABC-type transport system involved in multi-copper enzyme maturation permease subunit